MKDELAMQEAIERNKQNEIKIKRHVEYIVKIKSFICIIF